METNSELINIDELKAKIVNALKYKEKIELLFKTQMEELQN